MNQFEIKALINNSSNNIINILNDTNYNGYERHDVVHVFYSYDGIVLCADCNITPYTPDSEMELATKIEIINNKIQDINFTLEGAFSPSNNSHSLNKSIAVHNSVMRVVNGLYATGIITKQPIQEEAPIFLKVSDLMLSGGSISDVYKLILNEYSITQEALDTIETIVQNTSSKKPKK